MTLALEGCLRGEKLEVRRSGNALLAGVSIQVRPGELHAVLGPNGAGKSMLLRVLSSEIEPDAGVVWLNARPADDWPDRERACLRAVLPQSDPLQADFTAEEVVALGRTPCWRQSRGDERALVLEAMERTGCGGLRARRFLTLSGGERARVQLGRVLAQVSGPPMPSLSGSPRYLLLDEPTASLDLAHRHACLQLARSLAREGYGVLAVLHDPGLALQYGDSATVLRAGRTLAQGAVEATLSESVLSEAYGMRVELVTVPGRSRPMVLA